MMDYRVWVSVCGLRVLLILGNAYAGSIVDEFYADLGDTTSRTGTAEDSYRRVSEALFAKADFFREALRVTLTSLMGCLAASMFALFVW
jgi:hypothetical protein